MDNLCTICKQDIDFKKEQLMFLCSCCGEQICESCARVWSTEYDYNVICDNCQKDEI